MRISALAASGCLAFTVMPPEVMIINCNSSGSMGDSDVVRAAAAYERSQPKGYNVCVFDA